MTSELSASFGQQVGLRLEEQFQPRTHGGTLRLSRMGPQCPCALWHSVHKPHLSEPLPPWAEMKYSFGHILEAEGIMLAKAAGHLVEGEQDECILDGIVGHRDCIIDGCVVDFKSVTSRGFANWKTGTTDTLDDFGYLSQLDGYVTAASNDPLVKVKDRGYLVLIHKELGHMYLYEHKIRPDIIRERIETYKRIVELGNPPKCTCRTIESGKSGNIILAYPATYNSFKYSCFPHLRTFVYAKGPVYFVKVASRPKDSLMEVDKYGKMVYN